MRIQVLFPCLFFFCIFAQGQTPQAFSYQAIATDASGSELTEQALDIRASIISESINGTTQWIENHAIVTDPFGLFTIQIGTGTPAGGTQNNFSDINWASGIHFLKIEMDLEGTNDYVLVGTNQLLAVPYALHTDRSSFALMANQAIQADSSTYAETANLANFADSSTVASQAQSASYADTSGFTQNAAFALQATVATFATQADTANFATNAANANMAQNAQSAGFAQVAFTATDDEDKDPANELQTLSITEDSIAISNGNAIALDELDLFSASGLTLDFPQGTEGYEMTFVPDAFTVPNDQVFYLVAAEDTLQLPGVGSGNGKLITAPNLPVFPQGAQVAKCRCLGFLADMSENILPLISVLQPNGANFFQVPPNRQLIIKSGIDANVLISLNNITLDYSKAKAIVIPPGIQIRNESSEEIIITGYLKSLE